MFQTQEPSHQPVDILEKKVDLYLLNFLNTSFISNILKHFFKLEYN